MVLSPVDQGVGFIGQVEVLAAEVLPRVPRSRDQAHPVRHEAAGACRGRVPGRVGDAVRGVVVAPPEARGRNV